MTIYRNDYEYPIHADTFEELRKLREEGNRSFISKYYGPVCQKSELKTAISPINGKEYQYYDTKYFNIYTEQEVPASERCW